MHAQTACHKLKPRLLLSNHCHTDYFDVSLTDQFASVHPYCQQSQPGTSDRLQPRWQVLTSELQPERLSRATLVELCKTRSAGTLILTVYRGLQNCCPLVQDKGSNHVHCRIMLTTNLHGTNSCGLS